MTIDVREARYRLAEAAQAAPGIAAAYDVMPDAPDAPCVIIAMPETVEYNASFGNTTTRLDKLTLKATVLVGRIDEGNAQLILDALASGGTQGLKHAIELDRSLGGHVAHVYCPEASDFGQFSVGSTNYLGFKLTVEVWA